jgi:hypothetical protein
MQDDRSSAASHDDVSTEEDLAGPAAARKITDLVKAGNSCFFCTLGLSTRLHARPMTVTEVEDGGQLWFFTEIDSLKSIELDHDPRVLQGRRQRRPSEAGRHGNAGTGPRDHPPVVEPEVAGLVHRGRG